MFFVKFTEDNFVVDDMPVVTSITPKMLRDLCSHSSRQLAVIILPERCLARILLRVDHVVLVRFQGLEGESVNELAIVDEKVLVLAEVYDYPC